MSIAYDISLVLVGAVLGIGSSGAFWWLQTHRIVPRVRFSEELAEYPVGEPHGTFRAKFENYGKRNIIDLQIVVRVSFWKLGSRPMWTSINLEHNAEFVPALGPGNNKIVNVFVPELGVRPQVGVTSFVRRKIDGVSDLRDLLSLGEKAHLRLYVFGYDEYSGVRKLFRSKRYRLADIRKGVFRGLFVAAPHNN